MFCYLPENTMIILAIIIFNFISRLHIALLKNWSRMKLGFQLNITDGKDNKIVYLGVK